MYQDFRPVFRHGGDAAVVAPVPEKQCPKWLQPVWQEAEAELAAAEAWIVCGYSLPNYDIAIREMLTRAASSSVQHVFLLDPISNKLAERYVNIAPKASLHLLPGLPEGTEILQGLLQNMR